MSASAAVSPALGGSQAATSNGVPSRVVSGRWDACQRPAHEHLRMGGGHVLDGGRAALPAIRHDEVAGLEPKMRESLGMMLIGDDQLIQPLLAQIVAAMEASGTPAVGLHPHPRRSNQA